MTGTSDTERRMYGGFWIRTAAFLIDLIILTGIVLLVGEQLTLSQIFWV